MILLRFFENGEDFGFVSRIVEENLSCFIIKVAPLNHSFPNSIK